MPWVIEVSFSDPQLQLRAEPTAFDFPGPRTDPHLLCLLSMVVRSSAITVDGGRTKANESPGPLPNEAFTLPTGCVCLATERTNLVKQRRKARSRREPTYVRAHRWTTDRMRQPRTGGPFLPARPLSFPRVAVARSPRTRPPARFPSTSSPCFQRPPAHACMMDVGRKNGHASLWSRPSQLNCR